MHLDSALGPPTRSGFLPLAQFYPGLPSPSSFPLPLPSPPLQEEPPLKLYQILPPSLAGRAKVFGNKLALKDDWLCVDQPYFNAPGVIWCNMV